MRPDAGCPRPAGTRPQLKLWPLPMEVSEAAGPLRREPPPTVGQVVPLPVVVVLEDLEFEVAFQCVVTGRSAFHVLAGPEPAAEVHCTRCLATVVVPADGDLPHRTLGDPIHPALVAASHREAYLHRCALTGNGHRSS